MRVHAVNILIIIARGYQIGAEVLLSIIAIWNKKPVKLAEDI